MPNRIKIKDLMPGMVFNLHGQHYRFYGFVQRKDGIAVCCYQTRSDSKRKYYYLYNLEEEVIINE